MQTREVLHLLGHTNSSRSHLFKAANDCEPGGVLVELLPAVRRDEDALLEIIDQLIGERDVLASLIAANDSDHGGQIVLVDPSAGTVDARSEP